jgi:hypothetical protein
VSAAPSLRLTRPGCARQATLIGLEMLPED